VRFSLHLKSWSRAIGLGWLLCSSIAAAQEEPPAAGAAPSKQTIAEALFQQGRDLLGQGNANEACPKFAESQRIDPATGTLLNLAACHEAEGKFATAWSEFNEALVAAQRDQRADRVDFARQHIRDLDARLSRVVIRVAEKKRQASVQVRMDGTNIGRAGWGMAIPVDPGKHLIVATLDDLPPWTHTVEVGQAATTVDVEVPAWPAAVPLIAVPSSQPTPTRAGSKERFAAQLTGAAGAVALVAGGLFGWHAYSKWRDADGACPTARGCSTQAMDDRNAAARAATLSDVSIGVGVAALAVSAYLWVRSSHADPRHARMGVTPVLGPGSASMSVGTTW
jgi:hypothetical protein